MDIVNSLMEFPFKPTLRLNMTEIINNYEIIKTTPNGRELMEVVDW